MAKPKKKRARISAFVMMPFRSEFRRVYECIRRACAANGVDCSRVDQMVFQDNILHRIYSQIASADILIGEMTGDNTNVFYEIGYAHGLGKPVILLRSSAERIPFDFRHYPIVIYDDMRGLRQQLNTRMEAIADTLRPGWIVEMANDIRNYFEATEFTQASFKRLRPYVGRRDKDTDFREMIRVMPHLFAETTMEGGKPGLYLVA